jgi:PTH1 family peptidyl-tRNA hydrolase
MLLIAGLGNPTAQYERTRHNAGFDLLELFAHKLGVSSISNKFNGKFAVVDSSYGKIALLRPETYMNRSGISVAAAMSFYKIDLDNLIVLHDDLDLAIGKIKIKKGGGSGGQNGIKSIDSHIGTDYWRLRIGIGRPQHKDDVSNYVLSRWHPDEWEDICQLFLVIGENLEYLLQKKFDVLQSKVAQKL